MKKNLLQIINEIREVKGLSLLATLNDSDKLREDLGFTSFDLAELTVKIEDQYDVDVFEDGLIETVGEILSKIGQ